ncbi:MAG: hypothetical protein VYA53_03865 [Acidobacteriota bacterium]|nr:hypothetical protein [Acidobacteriota bacterium]
MSQKRSFSCLALVLAFLMVQAPWFTFSQPQEAPPLEESPQVLLGRDSPNLGGNTFRDAFIAMTLSDVSAVGVGKIVNEISFPSTGGIAFDRAELTPDLEASGATLEANIDEGPEGAQIVRITISATGTLPAGIIANLVFKVVKEFTFEEVGNEEHLIPLDNSVVAFTPAGEEIARVSSEPGGVDLAYAPVVFACFFYMH